MAVEGALLTEVFSKLSSPIVAELGLLWGVEKEQRKLWSNLSAIEAVLADAENRQVKDKAVRNWLGKLKDAAYDAQNLVDEFMIEDLRRKAEIRDSMQKKVRNILSTSNPLAFRFKMAHKMKKLSERLDEIAKERLHFHFNAGVVDSQPQNSRARETCSQVNASEVYGRADEKSKIIDLLLNEQEDISVIAIVGVGGLGKTTLAQLVFNDETVVTHFDLQMWVHVSEDFDVRRLVKEILQSAIKGTKDELRLNQLGLDQLRLDLLQSHLQEQLSGKKYLLVLDDVWNENHQQWNQLKTLITCGAVGGRKIVVTTRSGRVATKMRALATYDLGILSKDDCWSLFKHFAFEHGQGCESNLVSIGKEIVSKCGGVPLAIKTLGSLLYSTKSENQWLAVKTSEIWELEIDTESGILPALRLSYNHLASHLKQCFAYCAIFPKGHLIVKDTLIKQWIAQGFIQSGEGDELLEEKGDDYFNQLLSRSFFQDACKGEDDNDIICKIHDIIHDLARFVAGTECAIVEDRSKAILETTRHLSLCRVESMEMEAMEKCKKLRSILSFDPFTFRRAIDINVYLSFRRLWMLDLSRSGIKFLPISIGKLKHLRYLDLSNTAITELPETICNLPRLQTLQLLFTPLKKLPNDIRRLTSLRHVEFSENFPLPNGIGELTCLRTLSIFTVSEEGGCRIEELKDLNLLRGKLRIARLDNIQNVECAREANLNEKNHLSSLTLAWGGGNGTGEDSEKVIEYLEPNSNLQCLHVDNYMGMKFPRWRMHTELKLAKISLFNCKKCEHLQQLGQLSSLKSLYLGNMNALKYIVESSLPANDGRESECPLFPCLQILKVYNCPNLAHFPEHLPALEDLNMIAVNCVTIDISRCQSIKKVDLVNMPNLEEWIRGEEQFIFNCLLELKIHECPKLIGFPRLHLPVLESLIMKKVGFDKIWISGLLLLKTVDFTFMPNLVEWSSQQADDAGQESERDNQDSFHSHCNMHLYKCPKMISLPQLFPSLESLYIKETNEMLLQYVEHYTSLTSLYICGFPKMKSLPEVLGANNPRLRSLEISNCPKLISMSNQLKNLHALEKLTIIGCGHLVLFSDGLQCLGSLQELIIRNSCKKQKSFPGDGVVLTNLRKLQIEECKNLRSLFEGCPNLPHLECLSIVGCPKLKQLPEWVKNLTSLKSLSIILCKNLTSLAVDVDGFILSNLRSLTISWCENLESFFEGLQRLPVLGHLRIVGCPKLKYLPEWEKNLTSLESLEIGDWSGTLPLLESVENLKSLTSLWIRNSPEITSLPESMANLTWLSSLTIHNCPNVKALPAWLQRITRLQSLDIRRCPDLERQVRDVEWGKAQLAHVRDIRLSSGFLRGGRSEEIS